MSQLYSFDTIIGTSDGVISFDRAPSINDSGKVAVIGKIGSGEDILIGDGVNPFKNLSTSASAPSRFYSSIEINNNDQVVAIDIAFGSSVSTAARIWDGNNPGIYRKSIATGAFPQFGKDFENILPFVSINNVEVTDNVAFPADPAGANTGALVTFAGGNDEIGRSYNELVDGGLRPMLADDGRVVVRNSLTSVVVNDYALNLTEPIATAANGFTLIGEAPGISDNGEAVAFYGEKAGTKGIFVSVDTGSGWITRQIAGIAEDGILDPGETHSDNGDGEVDTGEDKSVIGNFDPHERIGITFGEVSGEDFGSKLGTVAYSARDKNGKESLISSQFEISSSSTLDVTHTEVTKVGNDASNAGLSGDIQDIDIYDPINKSGQIAYWVKSTSGEEAIVRANPIRKPVLIIPGIGGSLPDTEQDFKEWVMNRGFAPDRLISDPLLNTYKDLIESFERAGYTEGVDLFVATHDWRLSPGPYDENVVIDGKIERSIADLTDDTYEYSMDQLAFWMNKAEEQWKSQFPAGEPIQELESVDVIAHSAGGAVARSYIQSTAYSDENFTLPKVNNFITLGVPFRGSPAPYKILSNDFISDPSYAFLGNVMKFAYDKVTKKNQTIKITGKTTDESGSLIEGVITPEMVEDELSDPKKFLRAYAPNLNALLATYKAIERVDGSLEVPEEELSNKLLLDLNDGVAHSDEPISDSKNPNKFADKYIEGVNDDGLITGEVKVVHSSGLDSNEFAIEKDQPIEDVVNEFTGVLPETKPRATIRRFEKGRNTVPKPGELWYEIEKSDKVGDGSIVDESSFQQFDDYPHPNIEPKEFPETRHRNLAFDLETQKYIFDVLGVELDENLISTNLFSPLPKDGLFNFFFDTSDGNSDGVVSDVLRYSSYNNDPAEGFLIDGQGRRLGYTNATGAVTEIPGSQWFGKVDGIGFIPDIVEGPFRLELTGLGEDYFVSVSLETEEGQAFLESEGFLAAGEQLTLDVPVNNAPIIDLNGDADGIDLTTSISDQGGTFPIVDNNLTITDSESPNLAGATVTIQNPLNGNLELLAATATGNITLDYDAATSTLTLAGTDTIANYQQVLSNLTYTNNAANPDTTPREIAFVVDDGASFNNLSPVATVNTLFLPDGSNGQQTFTINKGSGTTTILNFGGVGVGTNPNSATLAQVDTLKFNGSGLTAKNLVLTQSDNDLVINFKGVNNTEVVLTDFALEDFDNLPNQIGNILFNGQSTIQDSIDVFDPQENRGQVFGTNKVTFLDRLNNSVNGFNNSNDVINGLEGNDLIQGKSGNDTLDGGVGNDTIVGESDNDIILGGDDDDTLWGNGGNDNLDGGDGSDRVFIQSDSNITLTDTLLTGDGTDTLISIEAANLYGNDDANLINAINSNNIRTFIKGNDGNDTIRGGAKNDGIQGNNGNDILWGHGGNDTINGGAGSDRIFVQSNNNITLTDTLLTGDGTDTLSSIEAANLYGNDDANLINAINSNNIKTFIQGNEGNDTIRGGAKNDGIQGNNGNDILWGHGGNDTINGGAGSDRIFV
ncbi:MAG: hypothetical protein AAF383_11910, partial [Cyanobacteria bacterium P01_A01_bin.83]